MTNFIFKSQGTYKKLVLKLEIIQSELRHQRSEHSVILRKLNLILHELDIRDQASKYYQKYGEDETSPQTKQETLVQDPYDPNVGTD